MAIKAPCLWRSEQNVTFPGVYSFDVCCLLFTFQSLLTVCCANPCFSNLVSIPNSNPCWLFAVHEIAHVHENPESSEANDWGNTTDDISSNSWFSFSGSTNSGPTGNGWADEPPENHSNGWGSISSSSSGSGSISKPSTLEASTDCWMHELPKDEYNGWGSDAKCVTAKARNNGWSMAKPPKDGCNGWADGLPELKLISKQAKTDAGALPTAESRPVNLDSWAPVIPSAPPLPENESVSMNEGKDVGASGSSCVVCWEAPVEGACVPCGHMAACMPCLKVIQSKQGTCPVCRAKIDQVMRIFAV